MKDEHGQNHYAVDPFPQPDAGTNDGDAVEAGPDHFPPSQLLADLERELGAGFRRPGFGAEILDFLADQGALNGHRRQAGPDDSRWRGLAAKLLKVMQYIKDHPNPTAIYAALHAWDIADFDDINGHLNQPQFAETIIVKYEVARDARGRATRSPVYLTKAAVNNAVGDAQKHFQLPPRKDQRGVTARATMRETRTKKLDRPEKTTLNSKLK